MKAAFPFRVGVKQRGLSKNTNWIGVENRSLTTLYPDIRREHHPPAPGVCELPFRQCRRHFPRPPPRRPRTHFLPRATRPRSPNRHVRHWTNPANLRTERPSAVAVALEWLSPHLRSGFSQEPVS